LKDPSLIGMIPRLDQVHIEILAKPHRPPQLPRKKVAVYAFFHHGRALKVGKVGPNSSARFSYQHYNPRSVLSTLAGSLLRNPAAAATEGVKASSIGQWIREHTDRVNLLFPDDLGDLFSACSKRFFTSAGTRCTKVGVSPFTKSAGRTGSPLRHHRLKAILKLVV